MRMVLFYGARGNLVGDRVIKKEPAPERAGSSVMVQPNRILRQYLVVVRSPVTRASCSITLSLSGVRVETLSLSEMFPKVPRPPDVSFEPASLEEEIS